MSELRITSDTLTPAMRRVAGALDGAPARSLLEAMGLEFRSMTVESFQSVSDRPAPWPAKKDGSPSNLVQSTTLRQSFQVEASAREARISSPTAYAAAHQFGSSKRGLPPRPFMPFLQERLTASARERLQAVARERLARYVRG